MGFMTLATALVLCARSLDSVLSMLVRRVLVVFSTAGFKGEGKPCLKTCETTALRGVVQNGAQQTIHTHTHTHSHSLSGIHSWQELYNWSAHPKKVLASSRNKPYAAVFPTIKGNEDCIKVLLVVDFPDFFVGKISFLKMTGLLIWYPIAHSRRDTYVVSINMNKQFYNNERLNISENRGPFYLVIAARRSLKSI